MKDYVESEAVNIEICGAVSGSRTCVFERGHTGLHWPRYGDGQFTEVEELPTPHELALKADAERLAELREELAAIRAKGDACGWERLRMDIAAAELRMFHVGALIAVYEECAARGLTFGGGR